METTNIHHKIDLTNRYISQDGRGVNVFSNSDSSLAARFEPPIEWGDFWGWSLTDDGVMLTPSFIKWQVRGEWRQCGAIGIFSPFSRIVSALNEENAREAARSAIQKDSPEATVHIKFVRALDTIPAERPKG